MHTYVHTNLHLQLFRADLISAMKLPDSTPMESGSFLTIKEPWRTEWEIGVQVYIDSVQLHVHVYFGMDIVHTLAISSSIV